MRGNAEHCVHGVVHSVAWAVASALMFGLSASLTGEWTMAAGGGLAIVQVGVLGWMAMHARSGRRAAIVAWLSYSLVWLWLNRWLIPVTAAGYPALGMVLAIYPALFAWGVHRVHRGGRTSRLPMTLVIPCVWTATEFLRGEVVMHGYPWFLMGHPMVSLLGTVQSADLLGAYFVGFLMAMVCGVGVDGARAISRHGPVRPALRWAIVTALVHAINLGYGLWRLNQEPLGHRTLRVLAVQTNLPQSNKVGWSAEAQARDVPEFIALTRRGLEQAGCVDLILWPETMLPGMGFEPATAAALAEFDRIGRFDRGEQAMHWPRAIARLQSELGIPLIVGSITWVNAHVAETAEGYRLDREQSYNSAVLLVDGAVSARYDKRVLTPFGEHMPYISAWPWLENQLLALGAQGMKFDLDSNPHPGILEAPTRCTTEAGPSIASRVRIAAPICFEDTVAWWCRRLVRGEGDRPGCDLLVNLSNDGWFGAHDAERERHGAIARFRCIETRTPMIRCVNTGFSMSIDSHGRVLARTQPRVADVLVANVRLDGRPTIYSIVGDAWGWCCVLTVIGLVAFSRRAPGETASARVEFNARS